MRCGRRDAASKRLSRWRTLSISWCDDSSTRSSPICDILPFDTIAALRTSAPGSRIVVCSAVLTEELRQNACRFGATDLLQKPVAIDRLVAAVRGKTKT